MVVHTLGPAPRLTVRIGDVIELREKAAAGCTWQVDGVPPCMKLQLRRGFPETAVAAAAAAPALATTTAGLGQQQRPEQVLQWRVDGAAEEVPASFELRFGFVRPTIPTAKVAGDQASSACGSASEAPLRCRVLVAVEDGRAPPLVEETGRGGQAAHVAPSAGSADSRLRTSDVAASSTGACVAPLVATAPAASPASASPDDNNNHRPASSNKATSPIQSSGGIAVGVSTVSAAPNSPTSSTTSCSTTDSAFTESTASGKSQPGRPASPPGSPNVTEAARPPPPPPAAPSAEGDVTNSASDSNGNGVAGPPGRLRTMPLARDARLHLRVGDVVEFRQPAEHVRGRRWWLDGLPHDTYVRRVGTEYTPSRELTMAESEFVRRAMATPEGRACGFDPAGRHVGLARILWQVVATPAAAAGTFPVKVLYGSVGTDVAQTTSTTIVANDVTQVAVVDWCLRAADENEPTAVTVCHELTPHTVTLTVRAGDLVEVPHRVALGRLWDIEIDSDESLSATGQQPSLRRLERDANVWEVAVGGAARGADGHRCCRWVRFDRRATAPQDGSIRVPPVLRYGAEIRFDSSRASSP